MIFLFYSFIINTINYKMLQTKISTIPSKMDQLNSQYPWLPSSITCRPDHLTLVEKDALIITSTPEDIITSIFENKKGWIFKPTQFRYNIPKSTNHWILWNNYYTMDWKPDPEDINEIIRTLLFELCGSESFDFGWYSNPKPTVSQYFHVQVFWIKL